MAAATRSRRCYNALDTAFCSAYITQFHFKAPATRLASPKWWRSWFPSGIYVCSPPKRDPVTSNHESFGSYFLQYIDSVLSRLYFRMIDSIAYGAMRTRPLFLSVSITVADLGRLQVEDSCPSN